MSQTRLERIGTIFTRVTGLMRAGSLAHADRPLWYDIYEAFPPEQEPRYDRPLKDVPVMNIFYPEDTLRARFQREFDSPGILRLRPKADDAAAVTTSASTYISLCDRLVDKVAELRTVAPGTGQQELYDAAIDALRSEGVLLNAAGADTGLPHAMAMGRDAQTEKRVEGLTDSPETGASRPQLRVSDLFGDEEPRDKP